jgi:hypothetical protein
MAHEASPAFHDANETLILSPFSSPDDDGYVPPTTRHGNNSSLIITTAAAQEGNSLTPSPLQQRELFPTATNNNGAVASLQYLSNYAPESLNMRDVIEEQAEGGDGDSVEDADDFK